MKKFVPIVLTTGLLMGTVAFGALACDRDNGPGRLQDQKKMEQHGRYQPPMGPRQHRQKVMVRVRVKRPLPVPASRVRKPAPAPKQGHGRRLQPKPQPKRPGHGRPPFPDRDKRWRR
ncbi:MAG: hypothetical protein PVG90_13215 [Bacillota bacterium]|jgi:hypothetical protein